MAYIRSLKDKEHDRHVLGEATIVKSIGDNLYLADYNGVKCTAIFNPFTGRSMLMIFMAYVWTLNFDCKLLNLTRFSYQ